uniref:Family with sequence similarity 228, member B n=1 Tax=Peromyscus maniculatus bairdii TaxID=230844 RepID=A0A8C8UHV4_PERMB
ATTMKTGRSQEDMVTGMLPRRKSSKEWLEPQSLSFMEVTTTTHPDS